MKRFIVGLLILILFPITVGCIELNSADISIKKSPEQIITIDKMLTSIPSLLQKEVSFEPTFKINTNSYVTFGEALRDDIEYKWSIVVLDGMFHFVKDEIEPEVEPTQKLTYLGTWTVTEYCTRCNSNGKRTTASGATAEEYVTAAVCYSNYKELKGKTLYVEGWGEFVIQDWGKVRGCNKTEWIDLFLPTSYHNKVWEKCNVYLVE